MIAGIPLLLILATPALACRGPQFHRSILLDAIPSAAEKSEVIAKVEILEVRIREFPRLHPFHAARARVLQSVRGISEGQIVEIYAEPSSCGGGLDERAIGQSGFIAGLFRPVADEMFFMGAWSNAQIGKF